MKESNYILLEKKTNEIGKQLKNWIITIAKTNLVNHDDYKEITLPLPDDIIKIGKAKINISLHQEPFNNIKHYHNFYEIVYVYKGSVSNIIDNNEIQLEENECIIQYPEVKHRLTNFSPKKSIIINITIDNKFFMTSFYKILFETNRFFNINENKDEGKYIVCKNLTQLVKMIIDIIIFMFLSHNNYPDSSYENVLVLLLMEILKNKNNEDNESFIYKLYSYISANISTISLNDCAAYFFYHPKYFCSLVKSKTGKSFKRIVIEKKIEKATYYLLNTDYSNSKISDLIGYENELSFYTNFKRIYKMSPIEYRKKHLDVK